MKTLCKVTLIFLILVTSTTSCSLFKKTERTVAKSDSTSNQTIKAIDKSSTTTIEKVDTTVKVKQDTLNTSLGENIFNQELNHHKPLDTIISSKNIDLNIKYNPKTKSFDFNTISKPDDVHVFVDKTIKKQNDITTDSKIKTEVKKKNTDKVSQPVFSGKNLLIGGLILIGLAGLIFIIVKLYNKFKSKLPL